MRVGEAGGRKDRGVAATENDFDERESKRAVDLVLGRLGAKHVVCEGRESIQRLKIISTNDSAIEWKQPPC
jgi:hypothetical protein